jgi:hypothetical protein
MSINRVGHMVGQQRPDRVERAHGVLHQVLGSVASQLVNDFRQKHPGEQCWLLVLDTREWIVQQFLRKVLPDPSDVLKQTEAQVIAAEGGKRPDVALWVRAVPRAAAIEVARFVAQDEPLVQAMCDEEHDDVVALCLAHSTLVCTALHRPGPGELAAAERDRRAARRRRADR